MASFYVICFIVFTLMNGGVQCAQWSNTSLSDSEMLYACAGDSVTLTWQYALTSEEVQGDVQWLYDGQSQELVAMFSRGNFLPTPTFSQRVARVDNAGLSLSRVLLPDSGNYSVEVNVYSQSGAVHTVLRRTAVLHVSDRLITTDGILHVNQVRDPVYDSVSNQWVLQLQCGNFIFNDNPPYQVEWTTPSGEVHNSTSFSNGNFYLSVPMPIESGSYTCRIPSHLSARACVHGNGTNEGRASVTVESVEARLLLLEKENSDLRHQLAASQAEVTQVKGQLSVTVADLVRNLTVLQASQNQEVQRIGSQLQVAENQLSTAVTSLQTRVGKIEAADAQQNQVAFHATGLSVSSLSSNSPLVFNHVICNLGNAYSPSTGYFTAPYPGLYFFIAKTSASTDGSAESHYLIVDSLTIDTAYTNNPQGTLNADQSPVHGAVHLNPGQRVYVKSASGGRLTLTTYSSSYSAFTGFLLSRDP